MQKTLSTVQKEKVSLQEQLSVLESKNKEYCKQLENKQNVSVEKEDNFSQTATEEQLTMTGELEKPEDILRQRIVELEKLEKHLKKQVFITFKFTFKFLDYKKYYYQWLTMLYYLYNIFKLHYLFIIILLVHKLSLFSLE